MPHTPPLHRISWALETALWNERYRLVAGVDEAGRGALAGPVVAAAVILPPHARIEHVDDSKRLAPARREVLYERIQRVAIGIGVGVIEAAVIDRLNIRQATLLAMRAAVEALPCQPDYLLIDGQDAVMMPLAQRACIRGDQTVGSIAAASIVAKVSRDRLMHSLDRQYPGYGLAQHKGYGTAAHLAALRARGPTPIHRRTFRGCTAP
jgi:ribonuclease HII